MRKPKEFDGIAITTKRGTQVLITYEHPYYVVYPGQGKRLCFVTRAQLDAWLDHF